MPPPSLGFSYMPQHQGILPLLCRRHLTCTMVPGLQIANGPGPANGTPNNLDDIYTPGAAPACQDPSP